MQIMQSRNVGYIPNQKYVPCLEYYNVTHFRETPTPRLYHKIQHRERTRRTCKLGNILHPLHFRLFDLIFIVYVVGYCGLLSFVEMLSSVHHLMFAPQNLWSTHCFGAICYYRNWSNTLAEANKQNATIYVEFYPLAWHYTLKRNLIKHFAQLLKILLLSLDGF